MMPPLGAVFGPAAAASELRTPAVPVAASIVAERIGEVWRIAAEQSFVGEQLSVPAVIMAAVTATRTISLAVEPPTMVAELIVAGPW
jgi:hypothetical protein